LRLRWRINCISISSFSGCGAYFDVTHSYKENEDKEIPKVKGQKIKPKKEKTLYLLSDVNY